jgi:hypothetical protein
MVKQKPEEWITSRLAADILTANSGHEVSDGYVRVLGQLGKLETKRIDARTRLYKRSDVEAYRVEQRGKPVKEAA